MGKRKRAEDFVPGLPLERYMNEWKVKMTFGADASVAVFEDFDTGMQAEQTGDVETAGKKWVLFGGIYQPAAYADIPTITSGGKMLCQLLYGTQAAFQDRDSHLVLAAGSFASGYSTNGGNAQYWPGVLDILHPKPVFSYKLTVGLQAVNHANFNSQSWVITLFFGWAEATSSDILAEIQQRITS